MTHWYPLESAGDDVFTSAPLVYRHRIRCAAAPQQVWDSLASDASVSAWGPSVKAVHWLASRPFGVDTTREVVLAGGAARVRERFYRWEPGRRYSFYVYEAGVPVFRRFAEDYVLEPAGAGTLLTWTIALEPTPKFSIPLKLLSPVNRFAFGRLAADGTRYFANRG